MDYKRKRGKDLPSIQDTTYPRFKSNLTHEELEEIYTPQAHEVDWADKKSKGMVQKLGLLLLLKTVQKQGFITIVSEIPNGIIQHIANQAHVLLPSDKEWNMYVKSRTYKRHCQFVREYLQIHPFNQEARKIMLDTMQMVSRVKDDPADYVNAAIEELIRQRFELPVFHTLRKAANETRKQSYRQVYDYLYKQISQQEKEKLDQLFQLEEGSFFSPWNHLKEDAKSASITNLKELLSQRDSILHLQINLDLLKQVPLIKVKQMATEAKTLNANQMMEIESKKRYALTLCCVGVQLAHVLDNIGETLVKRMMSMHTKGRKLLQEYKEKNQKRTDSLVSTLHEVLLAYQTDGEEKEKFQAMKQVIGDSEDQLLQDCEAHLAYSGNNYYGLLWGFYQSNRATLFKILQTVTFHSTTQDQGLEQAMEFLKANQNVKKECLSVVNIEKTGKWKKDWNITPLFDLSWIPDAWWRWVNPEWKKKKIVEEVNRRHFEVCLFSQIMWGLKSGDLYIEGSEKYADYREQLMSWEEYEEKLPEFCKKVNLPPTASAFVKELKAKFQKRAKQTDNSFPQNKQVRIEKGEVVISKLKRKQTPAGLKTLESYIAKKLEPVNVLDILADTEYWLNWTRFFGPISGHDAKIDHPEERYLTTAFCYGCNLGPTQTARSLGTMDRKQIAWINQRHITIENLDKGITYIVNSYNKFHLPRFWGDGKRAAADGTKWDLYERNLLSERHIRHGGYGGLGYYHVSDTYIALFSHFIPCGVWEGVYILDILMNDKCEIQPDVLHADTPGQSTTVFGLSALLGIELMPRIRNWKDLKMFRPTSENVYKHIDGLFTTDKIDWDLIETHYPDMLRVGDVH